jgi:beta-galactosidase
MSHVKIINEQLQVGEQTIPLVSGEVHYWRLEPDAWPQALSRVREMGLSVVASYICWDYHQLDGGRFDFHGDTNPRRNLVAFLDLLTREDFWIILRPSPYIYSEWRNKGVPDEAACYHRLHPTFLEMAQLKTE